MAAIYEFMYMHKTPVKVVIAEFLKVGMLILEIIFWAAILPNEFLRSISSDFLLH